MNIMLWRHIVRIQLTQFNENALANIYQIQKNYSSKFGQYLIKFGEYWLKSDAFPASTK